MVSPWYSYRLFREQRLYRAACSKKKGREMNTVVCAKNLTKVYHNSVGIFDLTIIVERGTVFGLLGANGAGKSTTMECILGTKKADKGEIEVLEKDPQKDRRKLFERIGVQFQEGDYQTEIRVAELCEETACLYRQPADWKKLCIRFGLGDKLKSAVKNLSGGERQKLFIVLALIPNPELVFLDELTTGLDAKARREVWNILKEMKEQGLTVFLTSHFMDEVEALCDQICILRKGRAVFCGTVEDAKRQCGCEKLEDAYLMLAEEEVE